MLGDIVITLLAFELSLGSLIKHFGTHTHGVMSEDIFTAAVVVLPADCTVEISWCWLRAIVVSIPLI